VLLGYPTSSTKEISCYSSKAFAASFFFLYFFFFFFFFFFFLHKAQRGCVPEIAKVVPPAVAGLGNV
jgi:hypothetical protein